jgi:hypothetical protein
MKKIILTFVLLVASFFFISFAEAAPAPWGIALNLETKECAGFWPGDEFVAYHLPDGWKSYFPKYTEESRWGKVETDVGECGFQIRKEEACCLELGYKYISDNIGKDQKTILRDRAEFENKLKKQRQKSSPYPAFAVIGLIILAVITIVLIIKRRRNKISDRE